MYLMKDPAQIKKMLQLYSPVHMTNSNTIVRKL